MQKTSSILLAGLVLLLLCQGPGVKAQGSWEISERHRLGAGFGFTFIPLAGELWETDARGLFVPSLRLDYLLHLYPRWSLGFMANYELDHYMIVDEQIERENALGLHLVAMFKITEHLAVYSGGGVEMEVHRNLGVFRLGTEYSIDLKKNWALIPKLYWDFKQNYNTWSLAFCLSKSF